MDCAIRGIHTLGLQIPLIMNIKEYPDDTPKESDTNQAEKENRDVDVDDDDFLKNDADDENAMMDFVKDEIDIDEKPVSMEDFSSNIPAKSVIPKADEGNACFVDDNGNDAHDKNDNDSENEEKPTIKTEIEIDEKPLIKENFFCNSAINQVIPKSEPLDSSIASESLGVGLASHNHKEFEICGRIAVVCLSRLEDEEPNFNVGNLNLVLKREFLLDDNNYEIGSTWKAESSSSHDDSPDENVEDRPSLASLREFRMKRARQRIREQDSINDDSDTMQTYKCGKCKFVAQTRKQLQTHSKIHNGKELICEICQYAAPNRDIFVKHYRIHTGEKPFECEICDHKSTQKQHLERHYRKHTGEKPYACTICDSKFSDSGSLKDHNMRIHTGEICKRYNKIFSCKICHSTFSRRYRLTRHEKTHTVRPRIRTFHCTECTHISFSSDYLSRHRRIHTGVEPFSCSECSYKTYFSGDFSKHKKIHSGVKPFCCDICGYRSIRSNHLKQHIRTHTGEKPYSCKECGQKFTSSTYLNHHRKIKHGSNDTGSNSETYIQNKHTNSDTMPTYKCGKCRFVGGTKEVLEKHSKIHNGKERICEICQYAAPDLNRLERHMIKHTGEKPYECNICYYKCGYKYNLENHKKRKHAV